MNNQNFNLASTTTTSPHPSNAKPAIKLRNGRQRQIDELYDLYDLAIIECLLKRHPSLESFSGA